MCCVLHAPSTHSRSATAIKKFISRVCRTSAAAFRVDKRTPALFICSRPRSSFLPLAVSHKLAHRFLHPQHAKEKGGWEGVAAERVCVLYELLLRRSHPPVMNVGCLRKNGYNLRMHRNFSTSQQYTCMNLMACERGGSISQRRERQRALYSLSSFSADDDFVYYKTVHSAGEGDA